jgi:hypothetical protein
MGDGIYTIGTTTYDTTTNLDNRRKDVFEYLFPITGIAPGSYYPEHHSFRMEVSTNIEDIWSLFDRSESLRIL